MKTKLAFIIHSFLCTAFVNCVGSPLPLSDYFGQDTLDGIQFKKIKKTPHHTYLSYPKKPNDFIKLVDVGKIARLYDPSPYEPDDRYARVYDKLVWREVALNEELQNLIGSDEVLSRHFPKYKGHIDLTHGKYMIIYEKLDEPLASCVKKLSFMLLNFGQKLQLLQDVVRAVHILHKLNFDHCGISPENFMAKACPGDENEIPSFKLTSLHRVSYAEKCPYGFKDYQDELLKYPLKKLLGWKERGTGEDFEEITYGSSYSIAYMVLTVIYQLDDKPFRGDIITSLRYVRQIIKSGSDKLLVSPQERLLRLLIDMLGLGRSIPKFEDVLYTMEEIMYESSKLLQYPIANYVPAGEWLTHLKTALEASSIKYDPVISIAIPPVVDRQQFHSFASTTTKSSQLTNTVAAQKRRNEDAWETRLLNKQNDSLFDSEQANTFGQENGSLPQLVAENVKSKNGASKRSTASTPFQQRQPI